MSLRKVHRTNINLWAEDVEYLRRIFGYGWTNQVRDLVSKKVKEIQAKRLEIGLEFTNDKAD